MTPPAGPYPSRWRLIFRGPFRLLLGLAIGLAAGLLAGKHSGQAVMAVAEPVGALWLDGLTMTVVPLLFGLLVTGVTTASRSASAGDITLRALLWFAVMLTTASLLSAALTHGWLGVWEVAGGKVIGAQPADPNVMSNTPISDWYRGIIPTNPIRAAADTAVVPLIVFALLLGFALARIDRSLADSVLTPLRALTEAMLVIVGWVLWIAPLGIAALAFTAGMRMGVDALGTLGQYVVVVSTACLMATLLGYVWTMVAGKVPFGRFVRSALPAQAVAIGTQSSLASLPVMVEAAGKLRLPDAASHIVLPLAVSLFRAASVAANVAVAVYLAHLHNVPMNAGTLILLGLLAVPVSLAAVGLPAQVSFFATIAPLCLAAGVPVAMLPLLLAIETVPDLFRTLGNVTNDLAVASIATR